MPYEFGLANYFAIFGGLHIEKVLLIIHGHLVEGSGLSQLLDTVSHGITRYTAFVLNLKLLKKFL